MKGHEGRNADNVDEANEIEDEKLDLDLERVQKLDYPTPDFVSSFEVQNMIPSGKEKLASHCNDPVRAGLWRRN